MIVAIVILTAAFALSVAYSHYLMRRIVCLEASIRQEYDKRHHTEVAHMTKLLVSKTAAEIDRFVCEGEREKERHQLRLAKLKSQHALRHDEPWRPEEDAGEPITSATFG